MITIIRRGNPGYSLSGGGGGVLLGDLGAADLVVPGGQVPVPVSNVLGHSLVNAGPESQLGRVAVATDNVVVLSLLAPEIAILLIGQPGQPWGVPVDPGGSWWILVDPADPHLVGDDPLK